MVGRTWAVLDLKYYIHHHHHQHWSQIRTCRSPNLRYLLTFSPLSNPRTLSFRLVSYNLRYDWKPDSITVKESLEALRDPTREPSYLSLAGREQPWSSRRIRIAQDLLSEGVVLAGARLCAGIRRFPF